MIRILTVRELIYDFFQGSSGCDEYFVVSEEHRDVYAAYCTAMYLIQDTAESLLTHRQSGFSTNPMVAYLEFWGVMQALIIQQDSIKELHLAILGKGYQPEKFSAWMKVRELRNECAGHPSNQANPCRRTFMGRNFGDYDGITYEQWDEENLAVSHEVVDLGDLIDRYAGTAKFVLENILDEMRERWN